MLFFLEVFVPKDANTLSVTEAAKLLRASYPQTMRWLLMWRLEGRKEDGRWRISATSVERLRAQRGTERVGFDEPKELMLAPRHPATAAAQDRSATAHRSSLKAGSRNA